MAARPPELQNSRTYSSPARVPVINPFIHTNSVEKEMGRYHPSIILATILFNTIINHMLIYIIPTKSCAIFPSDGNIGALGGIGFCPVRIENTCHCTAGCSRQILDCGLGNFGHVDCIHLECKTC